VCLITALARPQWGFTGEEGRQRGLDIVVAIDTSKSMLAEDIPPNRLARAKLAALELMQRAKSDRLGLVAFAGSAFLQCPLTIDDAVFRQSVEALDVHSISEGGTAIAEAIDTALAAFKEGDNHKVLVLFSDGEDQDSGAVEAAKKAAAAGLQIFTIGIGSAEGELLRVKDANGGSDYIRDEQGNVVKSHLNEELLKGISSATERGFYLPLRGAKAIDMLYDTGLAPLPKSEGKETLAKRLHERYHWPLALGILLLIAEMLLPERKREARMRPAAAVTPTSKPALARAVAVLLLLALPLVGLGSPGSALREYQAGQYDQALKEYEQLLKRKGDDPRLHFNAGASAYRNRQFEEAAKQFEAALTSPDLKLQSRAYYNRGNALYYLGEAYQDPSKKSEAWEQSLKAFQSTMKLNPQDADARFNRDLVRKRLEELKNQQQQSPSSQNTQPSEAAKKAKAQADDAVRHREYSKALDIMEKQLDEDPTTNYYAEFIKKLKEVLGVQDSAKH
jgi:Ca-activated chloride channel homolog